MFKEEKHAGVFFQYKLELGLKHTTSESHQLIVHLNFTSKHCKKRAFLYLKQLVKAPTSRKKRQFIKKVNIWENKEIFLDKRATLVGLEPTTFELHLKCLTRSPTRYPLRHRASCLR